MIFKRLLAYIFLCLAIMILGAEGLRLLEGGESTWITVEKMFDLMPLIENLDFENKSSSTKGGLKNISEIILNFPAFFACMLPSVILFILSRATYR